jgi:hypothetical protein
MRDACKQLAGIGQQRQRAVKASVLPQHFPKVIAAIAILVRSGMHAKNFSGERVKVRKNSVAIEEELSCECRCHISGCPAARPGRKILLTRCAALD